MRKRLPFILLALLLLIISYGQTIFMYFWQDDSALLFKLQHQAEIAGSFGAGLFDRGPYRYLVVPFVPFYPLFGLHPFGYFFIGFLTYAGVVLAFYFLAREIFQKKSTAFLSTLLCAAGYIGSDTMFRVINSWQTNIGIILGIVLLIFYLRFIKHKTPKYYLLALITYISAIEFVFIRSHAIIASVVIIDIGFEMLRRFSLRELIKSTIRLLPFVTLFSIWYLKDASFGAPGIKNLFDQIFNRGEWSLTLPFISNMGNVFFPDLIINRILVYIHSPFVLVVLVCGIWLLISILLKRYKKLTTKGFVLSLLVFVIVSGFLYLGFISGKYYFRDITYLGSGLVASAVGSLLIGQFLSTDKKEIKIALLIGVVTLLSQIGSYYVQYPTAIFGTTHRYFSYAFIGYCLCITALLSSIGKKVEIVFTIFIVSVALFLGWRYQHNLLIIRSNPTYEFYSDLQNFAPQLPIGSLVYFDIERNPVTEQQFNDFFSVGSMPETTALAIYYNIDRYDVTMVTNPDELLSLVHNDPRLMDKLFAFRYTTAGLTDITTRMKKLMTSKLNEKENNTAYVYTNISFDLQVLPHQYTAGPLKGQINIDNIVNVLSQQKNEREYYQHAKATSKTEWKYREIENVLDQDRDTPWQGHRVKWFSDKNERLTIDLQNKTHIAAVKWINWKSSLTPTEYTYEISSDGDTWKTIKSSEGGEKQDGEEVIDTLPPVDSRYIRMNISKTLTDDSPAITEFIVYSEVPNKFSAELLLAAEHPFDYVATQEDWNKLIKALDGYLPIHVQVETSEARRNNFKNTLYVKDSAELNKYSIVFPPGGGNIKNISLKTAMPFTLNVRNLKYQNIPIDEMQNFSLIKRIAEN